MLTRWYHFLRVKFPKFNTADSWTRSHMPFFKIKFRWVVLSILMLLIFRMFQPSQINNKIWLLKLFLIFNNLLQLIHRIPLWFKINSKFNTWLDAMQVLLVRAFRHSRVLLVLFPTIQTQVHLTSQSWLITSLLDPDLWMISSIFKINRPF